MSVLSYSTITHYCMHSDQLTSVYTCRMKCRHSPDVKLPEPEPHSSDAPPPVSKQRASSETRTLQLICTKVGLLHMQLIGSHLYSLSSLTARQTDCCQRSCSFQADSAMVPSTATPLYHSICVDINLLCITTSTAIVTQNNIVGFYLLLLLHL